METVIIIIFIIGYVLIAFEHPIKVNKSATAIVTGVLCWTLYAMSSQDQIEEVTHHLAALWRHRCYFVFLIGCNDHC
jgi:hypothetical protein